MITVKIEKIRKLLTLLFLVGFSSLYSQTLVQTYTDRCTGETKVYSVAMGGQTTIVFYDRARTFTSNQFQNGELRAWLEETYLWWATLNPCSTAQTQATTTQAVTQQTTQAATQAATSAATTAIPAAPATPPPTAPATAAPPTTNTAATTNTGGTTNTSTNETGSTTNTGSSSGSTSSGDTSSGTDTSSSGSTEGGSAGDSSGSTEGGDTGGEAKDGGSSTEESKTEETKTEETKSEEKTEEVKEEKKEETKEETKEEKKEEDKKEEKSEEKEEEKKEEKSDEEKEKEKEEEKKKEEEEKKKKRKEARQLGPPIITANTMAMQGLDGRYSYASNFGVSRSSLMGDKTYGLNTMVWSNLKQFMLTANFSKVHINKEGRVSRVYSASLGGAKMFTTVMGMMNHSVVFLGKKGSAAGLALGSNLTSIEFNVREKQIYFDELLAGASITGFYTKPIPHGRFTFAPMVALSSSFLTYELTRNQTIWNKDLMIIGGLSTTFNITKRFGANLGVNAVGSTNPTFPIIWNFTIGSRFSF